MASSISSNSVNSYQYIDATDIKAFLIESLKSSGNVVFKDVDYLGSNVNALIDIFAVILQQLMFHMSVQSSESTLASALIYENVSKIVNMIGYKPVGKQTSMLPVKFDITLPQMAENITKRQFTLPRFTSLSFNSNFVLSDDIIRTVEATDEKTIKITIETVLHQGTVKQSPIFVALGDEFETFVVNDSYINNTEMFISDNFFSVFVDETGNGDWVEYTETSKMFLEDSNATKYEKRMNENYNYEFKFGNGIHGKKLVKNARVVVFYILSSGEISQIGDGIIDEVQPIYFTSALYDEIKEKVYKSKVDMDVSEALSVLISNTGPSTSISYPESVESIKKNAPKLFASQNRLFSLDDYRIFVENNFDAYVKDSYFFSNEEYISSFLKYYYDMGIDRPQKDSRLNFAQVEWMTAVNFNNVYGIILPKVNTLINGKIPNYLNSTIKEKIINKANPYKGISHNIVLLDPIFKACTWGSSNIDYDYMHDDQLKNRLVIVRKRLSNYSVAYIKENVVNALKTYFQSFILGSTIDFSAISRAINTVGGVESFYIEDIDGNTENKMTMICWNPLYSSEDCKLYQQNILNEPFVYPYFYDLDNIQNTIDVISYE